MNPSSFFLDPPLTLVISLKNLLGAESVDLTIRLAAAAAAVQAWTPANGLRLQTDMYYSRVLVTVERECVTPCVRAA